MKKTLLTGLNSYLKIVMFGSLLLLTALSLLPGLACATPISGTSTGTLVPDAGSTTTVTQVNPYQVSWNGPGSSQTSYLTAGTASGQDIINQNYVQLGGSNVRLASLSWLNNDNLNGQTVNLGWNVTVNLTDPIFSSPLARNSLNITLQNGGKADTMALDDLSSINWAFDVWNVTNFHYMTDSQPVSGSLDGLNWTTIMGQSSTLWVVADFIDPPAAPSSVPEPSTMMLLGFGMLSLAVYGKRRMNKAA